MYYRSKSEFYIRQYVLPICAIVISMALIGTGGYVYWTSHSNNALKQNLVTASSQPDDKANTDTASNVEKNEENLEETLALENTTDDLKELPNLELSDDGLITNVSEDGILTFNYSSKDYSLSLIGINTSNTTESYIDTLKNDLLNKKVKVAFDNKKSDGDNLYAYIYLNNKLYNEHLLEDGIATYKEEQNNTTYKSDLIQAQAYAKQLTNGVWKK